MGKTTEQKVALALQDETGSSYSTCLRVTREVRADVQDGPDFVERWQAVARAKMPGANPERIGTT